MAARNALTALRRTRAAAGWTALYRATNAPLGAPCRRDGGQEYADRPTGWRMQPHGWTCSATRSTLFRPLHAPIRMLRKTPGFPVGVLATRPGPAAEFGALVVTDGLDQLFLGVHHERPARGHRFTDRPALQHEHLDRLTAVVVQRRRLIDPYLDHHPSIETRVAHHERAAGGQVDGPPGLGRGCRQRQARPRVQAHDPD